MRYCGLRLQECTNLTTSRKSADVPITDQFYNWRTKWCTSRKALHQAHPSNRRCAQNLNRLDRRIVWIIYVSSSRDKYLVFYYFRCRILWIVALVGSCECCPLNIYFVVRSCEYGIFKVCSIVGSWRSWILIFCFIVGSWRSWISISYFVAGFWILGFCFIMESWGS